MTVRDVPYANEIAKQARAYGESLAAWVFDGNTETSAYRKILKGYEDGDPEVLDLCISPLSGEFADGPTPDSVLGSLGLDYTYEGADTLLDIYEDVFQQTWWDTVLSAARRRLKD